MCEILIITLILLLPRKASDSDRPRPRRFSEEKPRRVLSSSERPRRFSDGHLVAAAAGGTDKVLEICYTEVQGVTEISSLVLVGHYYLLEVQGVT